MSYSKDKDPIANGIYNGIKKGIELTLENECFNSMLVLIYSGIDVLASLGRPDDKEKVTRSDYIAWCDKYIKFNCEEKITGQEFYSARCGLLHANEVETDFTKDGICRMIGYMDKNSEDVVYNPNVNEHMVMLSMTAFAQAFFNGIDKFVVDLFSSNRDVTILNERLNKFAQQLPIKLSHDGNKKI